MTYYVRFLNLQPWIWRVSLKTQYTNNLLVRDNFLKEIIFLSNAMERKSKKVYSKQFILLFAVFYTT